MCIDQPTTHNKQQTVLSSQQTTNNPQQTKKPELMAPAGDWTMLNAVIKSGADAVYFGVDKLNMRMKAANFELNELSEISEHCRNQNIKSYVTLNTIIFEEEIEEAEEIIKQAKDSGIDRIICWDLAAAQICREYQIPFCISTQGSVSNSLSANFYKSAGAVRVVLARECSLEEIKKIRANTNIEIEAFVHGAMCIAVSGRCYMSHYLFDKSANRGECVQPCRREYEVYDAIIDKSMMIGEDYVLSPKDLCTIEFIDELIEAGINSFKIEGRKRSPEYAAKVVSVYRRGIDSYFERKFTPELKKNLVEELREVYNRGFSSGFYFGKPTGEDYANAEGSIAKTRKEYIGKILNYYKIPKAAYMLLESGKLSVDNEVYIIGKTTGVINLKIKEIMKEDLNIDEAVKGDKITFPCEEIVRPHDAVYLKLNRF
ncbi:MAG TPA: peptidase U32 family protein [Ignavibacteriaceae bacterium]|nr:peptidase U32 family protein [Ignavibacteriaceae bacterium]